MSKCRKSQLFSLDLMLALVPLTIALGMSANAMSGVMNQMQEYSEWYSTKDRVDDAVDVILKTPGVPAQWNETNPPIVLGLAVYTETRGIRSMYIDEDKFSALNSTYPDAISSLLGTDVSYYNLTVIGLAENMTNFSSSIANGTRADASSIYASERLAFYKFATIVGNPIMNASRWDVDPTYVCYVEPGNKPRFYSNFTVKQNDTDNYDYWIVADCETCSVNVNYRIDPEYDLADGKNRTDCSGFIGGDFPEDLKLKGGSNQDCACTGIDWCREDVGTTTVVKKKITDELTEGNASGLMNTVFFRFTGKPQSEINIYIVRVAKDSCESDVSATIVGYWPVMIRMEIGL